MFETSNLRQFIFETKNLRQNFRGRVLIGHKPLGDETVFLKQSVGSGILWRLKKVVLSDHYPKI